MPARINASDLPAELRQTIEQAAGRKLGRGRAVRREAGVMSDARPIVGCATIELPYPPSVNHYWRHVGPKVLISAEGRAYRQAVAAGTLSVGRVDGRVKVEVLVYPPDRRRRDLDNTLKGLLDSIKEAGIIEDDERIDDLRIVRREPIKGGKVLILIRRIAEAA